MVYWLVLKPLLALIPVELVLTVALAIVGLEFLGIGVVGPGLDLLFDWLSSNFNLFDWFNWSEVI